MLPFNIIDCVANEDHSALLLGGTLGINYANTHSISEPSPLGYLGISQGVLVQGQKVRIKGGKTGVLDSPMTGGWMVCVSGELFYMNSNRFSPISTNYQIYSTHGVSFPVGKRLRPSGCAHTLVFDPDYGQVRSLSALEAWGLQGGDPMSFSSMGQEYCDASLMTTSSVALQVYLTGLGVGCLSTFSVGSTRSSGRVREILYKPFLLMVDMPSSSHHHSRINTISRMTSRLLRHGPRRKEGRLDINLQDGGSVLVSGFLLRCAMRQMHVTQAEVMHIATERESGRKMRFEIEATLSGPKIRCLQGHTLPVTRVNAELARTHQRYLLHATDTHAAAEILRSGMQQMKNRQEFHFVELNYDTRQSNYLISNNHTIAKRVWLVLDTQLAAGMGYRFVKLNNGVVVSSGDADGQINRSVFVSVWLSDTQSISMRELLTEDHKIVVIDHDTREHQNPRMLPSDSPDPPRANRERMSRTPVLPPEMPDLSVSDYQPQSPTPSQMELPESERPPSRTPAGESPPMKKARPATPTLHPNPDDVADNTTVVPSAAKSPSPTFTPQGFTSLQPPQFILNMPPQVPQLSPNTTTIDLQAQIAQEASKEVDRRLAHMGQPPVITPSSAFMYGPPQSNVVRPSINVPQTSFWKGPNDPQSSSWQGPNVPQSSSRQGPNAPQSSFWKGPNAATLPPQPNVMQQSEMDAAELDDADESTPLARIFRLRCRTACIRP